MNRAPLSTGLEITVAALALTLTMHGAVPALLDPTDDRAPSTAPETATMGGAPRERTAPDPVVPEGNQECTPESRRDDCSADAPSPTLLAASGGRITMVAGDEADLERLRWAIARFDEAGLWLPDIAVAFHEDDHPCGGHAGIRTGGGDTERIDVCVDAPMILLHELAHSHATGVPEPARAAFVELRGLTAWSGPALRWDQRGSEHFAHIVAWGLMDDPPRVTSLPDPDVASLTEAFVFATGRTPLHAAPSGDGA